MNPSDIACPPILPPAPAGADSDATYSDPQVQVRPVALRCADGRLLAAQWFEPPAAIGVRAVAVISSATAVPASYYRYFAEWLARRGYAVLSFDYRGIAASRSALLPGEDVRLRDWARVDMAAALHAADRRRCEAATAEVGEVGLLWVGHSLGGNAVGLVPGFEDKVDALLGVAAQVAYLGHWSGLARLQAWLFFHLMLPLAVRLFGRAPGRLLGPRAEDLPAGAALEWAAWGRTPGFLFGDESLARERAYDRFAGAVHLWSITDDHLFGPAPAVDALAGHFGAARVQRHSVSPADLGVGKIEHFGPFRRDLGAKLWPRLLERIEAATPRLAARLHSA
ncbi:serine aminopeptidase domain-containing protein [Roseateles saccharophilus]|uniref:alpha/beta hydrolase family protein n=1 Tax=Roseateles saccharophilus TaxID=304 RepID=UPI0024088BB6|nr:alpha/beta hydrolase [Roseateles saccharophilus]